MGKLHVILGATNVPNPFNSSNTFFSDTMKTKRNPLQCFLIIQRLLLPDLFISVFEFQHTHHGFGTVIFANFCQVMDCESNGKLGKQTVCFSSILL